MTIKGDIDLNEYILEHKSFVVKKLFYKYFNKFVESLNGHDEMYDCSNHIIDKLCYKGSRIKKYQDKIFELRI
jgi:hypothetical protein